MLIGHRLDTLPSELTPSAVFAQRRQLLLGASALFLGAGTPLAGLAATPGERFGKLLSNPLSTDEKPTRFEAMTTYGNFYEFGPDKDSPAKNAQHLRTRPWTITVDGEVKSAKTFAIEDILSWAPLEERIYRFRCVEGWSAVVPWVGFPFAELLKRVEITGNARFVEFWSLADREQMALASCYAGQAFTRASVGNVHALAHALGARCRVPHGQANALLLPGVLRFSRDAAVHRMARLARQVGLQPE